MGLNLLDFIPSPKGRDSGVINKQNERKDGQKEVRDKVDIGKEAEENKETTEKEARERIRCQQGNFSGWFNS